MDSPPSQSQNRHGPPITLPDPGFLFPESITYAVREWHSAVNRGWPNIRICEEEEPGCRERNTDNKITVIKTVSGYVKEERCDISVGCVKYELSIVGQILLVALGPSMHPINHLGGMTMRLEEPAYGMNSEGRDSQILWVDETMQDGWITSGGKGLRHLKTIVMHEFGHTIGLYDLYLRPEDVVYPGFLMTNTVDIFIPRPDEMYAKQLYRNGHGGIPH